MFRRRRRRARAALAACRQARPPWRHRRAGRSPAARRGWSPGERERELEAVIPGIEREKLVAEDHVVPGARGEQTSSAGTRSRPPRGGAASTSAARRRSRRRAGAAGRRRSPSQTKCPPIGPRSSMASPTCGDVVEERRDLAVVEPLDGQLDRPVCSGAEAIGIAALRADSRQARSAGHRHAARRGNERAPMARAGSSSPVACRRTIAVDRRLLPARASAPARCRADRLSHR